MRRPILATALAAVAVSMGCLGLSPMAQAATENSGWASWGGTYSLDRNIAWITQPVTVTVSSPSGAPICGVKSDDLEITAAPWSLTVSPDSSGYISVDSCDGEYSMIEYDARSPFTVDTKVLQPGLDKETVRVRNSMNIPAHVRIINTKGSVLTEGVIGPEQVGELNISTKGLKSTGSYTVQVTADGAPAVSSVVVAPVGWAPMYTDESYGPSVAACSTVPWYFDAAGNPNGAKGLRKDIQPALNRLGKETGLKFVEVTSAKDATLTFGWQNLGRGGPSARGGYSVHTSGGVRSMRDLHVAFNRQDNWVNDRNAGLGYQHGLAGRGWLVIHEVMHTLGFAHVDNSRAVMAPINRGQHSFSTGDLEGLRAMYPRTCTTG